MQSKCDGCQDDGIVDLYLEDYITNICDRVYCPMCVFECYICNQLMADKGLFVRCYICDRVYCNKHINRINEDGICCYDSIPDL